MTAANGNDLHPAGKLHAGQDALRHLGLPRSHKLEETLHKPPDRMCHDPQREDDHERAADRKEGIAVAARHLKGEAQHFLFQDTEDLVIQNECRTEDEKQDAQREKQHPPLHRQPRIEPLEKMSHTLPSMISFASCSTGFLWRSRCSMLTRACFLFRYCPSFSVTKTERCMPPVQPMAMVNCVLPAASN